MKIPVKFTSYEEVSKFVNLMETFKEDVNLYAGSITRDAKSIIGVTEIISHGNLEAEIITPDEKVDRKFYQAVSKFRG